VGGAGVGSTVPAVASHASVQVPSSNEASRTSLIHIRKSVSSSARPMPYGSSVNGSPRTSNVGSSAAKPARMTLSVLIASTWPPRSGSRQSEYAPNGTTSVSGKFSRRFASGVEPETVQTFLPARSSGPWMSSLSASVRIDWPAS
jgi:hypothetical protein